MVCDKKRTPPSQTTVCLFYCCDLLTPEWSSTTEIPEPSSLPGVVLFQIQRHRNWFHLGSLASKQCHNVDGCFKYVYKDQMPGWSWHNMLIMLLSWSFLGCVNVSFFLPVASPYITETMGEIAGKPWPFWLVEVGIKPLDHTPSPSRSIWRRHQS